MFFHPREFGLFVHIDRHALTHFYNFGGGTVFQNWINQTYCADRQDSIVCIPDRVGAPRPAFLRDSMITKPLLNGFWGGLPVEAISPWGSGVSGKIHLVRFQPFFSNEHLPDDPLRYSKHILGSFCLLGIQAPCIPGGHI